MCALDARGPQGREGVEDRGNINMGLQSGNTVKPKTTKPPSETRKIRKPLMERKRRERINTSLNDLAVLLTEANLVKGETGKASKLEKADILELTVKHLKELKETRSQGDTCSASTSTGVGKDRTEAAASGKTYNSGDDTSSDNANNKHTEQSEDKQNRNHIVKETRSDGKHDKITCAACSLPLKNSGNSSNVCEIINSQEQKSSCSTEEQRTNPSSAGPSSSKGSAKNENYALGFKKCMSAIESVMKVKQDNENYHQANIRPKLLNHLKNFLKSIDIDLKTSVTSSQVCIDTLSLDDSDSSSTGTDVSSTTSETNSNISPLPSLTLVPTRLPGGNLAFVVQEGAGATALLQSAEIMLQKPETKEEKSAHKRPTEGKSIIKSEDSLLSDDIKTRKKEDSHPIKVESSNYTTQTHTKESLEQSPSQLQSPLQPVFKQTVVSNTNLTVQPSPISTAAMTPDRPSKVSQKITENSPENERQDNYNLPLTPQTPTVRPPTVNTVSSPLITPSTPREHFIVKRAICASRATTAVAPLRPVDTNISQLPKTSLLPNENLTLPSTSTFDTRTIFTPVKESTSFDFYHPVTPKTPNSENGSQQIQSSSLTSHSSMSYPSSFALSTPTASTSFHAIYTDQTQFLTPPPTPIGYESLRKTSVNLYQECESSFVCNPSPLQHSSTSTSQLTLRSPSDSHLNLQNDRAKTTEEKNERDRPQERRDGVENPFMGEERRNHQDNDLPFDLSLRRMWRPW